jgi:branched-subunit amino acid ABC-type transport system permease component
MRRALHALSALTLTGLVLGLGGCSTGIDADQARICRTVIPALNPGHKALEISPAAPGHRPFSVRIGYRVIQPEDASGATARDRAIICLFRAGGLDHQKGELIGVATEEGPLSDGAFYFLRRFWLEDRQEPPLDPGPPPVASVLQLSPVAGYVLQQFIVALPMAATYALMAASYALIYGLVGRIILAFGEFAALGGLAGVVGVAATLSLAVTTPVTALLVATGFALFASALHGFAAGRVAIGRLMAGGTGQQVLIGSVGLSLALSEYLRIAVGPQMRWLPPVFNEPIPVAGAGSFTVTATPIGLFTAASGFAVAGSLVLWLNSSDYGRRWRALADDPKAAALCGVNAVSIRDIAFIVACALAGAAGLIVTVLYGGLGFAGGFTLGLKSLIAAILGGVGSVPGAMLGGLALACFEAIWVSALPIEHRDLAVFSLLAVILILRPGGFFGEGRLAPREV